MGIVFAIVAVVLGMALIVLWSISPQLLSLIVVFLLLLFIGQVFRLAGIALRGYTLSLGWHWINRRKY